MRRTTLSLLVIAIGLLGATAAAAEEPVGGISFHERSLAAGIGYSWGSGTLHFQGQNHSFKVSDLSVGHAGAEDVTAVGSVYRLTKLSDFNGNYTAAGGDLTIGGGEAGTVMQNQNGVVIRVRATTQGIAVKLATEGIKITLK